jgi:NADPH-dependent 2,4-dienoyl-CoA reductase/sulfur reductase-like enzyme
MSRHFDLVVIGGGPAGITLARMLGRRMRVAVVRPEAHSMIYCAMPYAIEGIMPPERVYKKDTLVTEAGAELVRDRAVRLDLDSRQVFLAEGEPLTYGKLVLTMGSLPIRPPLPGIELPGAMTCKTQEDLTTLCDLAGRGLGHAVVVGAGAIGIELAQALNARGVHTTLVDMMDSILPNLADADMVTGARALLEENGIETRLGVAVESLTGDGCVEGLRLGGGETLAFTDASPIHTGTGQSLKGIVVFAVGARADLDLVRDTALELGRDGIRVDSRMRTNLPDVYACGDCVEFASGITGEVTPGRLATNAVPMAKVLGRNLLGEDREYPGFFNGAATRVYDQFIGGTGLTEAACARHRIETVTGYGETTTQFPIMPDAKPLRVKLIARRDSGRLVGAQVVSGEPVAARIDLLTFAIQAGAGLRELTELSYSSQPYQAFFPAANAVVLAAENALAARTETP